MTTFRNTAGTAESFRPQVENLEVRQCLSTTVTTIDSGHTLKITGDSAADRVEIRVVETASNGIQVRYNYQANGTYSVRRYDPAQISKIDIDLKGGSDTFRYYQNSDLTNQKEIDLKL